MPAPRREFVAEAYERLRHLIVQGQLGPGMRLIETELAERLGMSRTPVRTALYLLNQEGFVEVAGKGRHLRLSVAPLTQEDATEIFDIVGEIEGLAARRAARLAPAARRALAAELRDAQCRDACRSDEEAPQPERDDPARHGAFHRAYVEAGAGRRLLGFFRSVKPHADRFIHLYYTTLTTEIIVSTQEHGVIIDAIAAGDPAAALDAVRTNWRNAAERLAKSISAFGERGVW